MALPPTKSRPTPILSNDITEAIFLRIRPNEAESLVRVSLTSKFWSSRLSGSSFCSQYVERHGNTPLLGFFCRWPELYEPKGEDTVGPFVSTSLLHPPYPDDMAEMDCAMDCRHGRALLADLYADPDPVKFLIWDPITGRRRILVAPREYDSRHAAVICADSACKHLACHEGNSKVVFVGVEHVGAAGFQAQASAYVYSTETGQWSQPSPLLHLNASAAVLQNPSVLVNDKLYFVLKYDEDDLEDGDDTIDILMYDLTSHSLAVIDAPTRDLSISSDFILLAMENGALGFASLGWSSIHLWSQQMGPEGLLEWTAPTIVEHRNPNAHQEIPNEATEILGSFEGRDILIVDTNLGIYKFNLKSLEYEKIWKKEVFFRHSSVSALQFMETGR
ncbi:uncharacterized protein LOC125511150 [Triticum urartu]|nr:uncharacterized protein LOC125511150 [Triticum urartu]